MVVDDDAGHLRSREIGVPKSTDEPSMSLRCKRLSQELLPRVDRKENHRVTEVDDEYSTALIEAPIDGVLPRAPTSARSSTREAQRALP